MRIDRRATRIAVLCTLGLLALPAMVGAQVYVKSNFLGVGIDTPTAPMHAVSTVAGAKAMLKLTNNGAPFAFYEDTNLGVSWGLQPTGGGTFTVTLLGSGGPEFAIKQNGQVTMGPGNTSTFTLTPAGNLTITGSISTTDCNPCVSDYVFETDYELMPLDELAQFVATEKHLPNVPSQGDVDQQGALNMTQMQMRMLEKIEELVLYTLDQQNTIDELTERLARVEAQ